jgi:hypothetical protein
MRYRTENDRAAVDDDPILDQALASLAHFSPAPGFEDRVMARVVTPEPMWIPRLRSRSRSTAATGRLSRLAAALTVASTISMSVVIGLVALNAADLKESLNGLLAEVGLPLWRALLGITVRVAQDIYLLVHSVALPGPVWAAIGVGGSLTMVFNVWMLRRLIRPGASEMARLNAPH